MYYLLCTTNCRVTDDDSIQDIMENSPLLDGTTCRPRTRTSGPGRREAAGRSTQSGGCGMISNGSRIWEWAVPPSWRIVRGTSMMAPFTVRGAWLLPSRPWSATLGWAGLWQDHPCKRRAHHSSEYIKYKGYFVMLPGIMDHHRQLTHMNTI